MKRLLGACVLVFAMTLAAAPGYCDPAWLPAVEKLIAAPGSGAAAVKQLEALPLADRQTRDYHWALARAYQADAKPGPAGDAARVMDMLPPGGTDRDLSAVSSWLKKTSVDEYKAAMAAQKKADKSNAVKSYLRAVTLDPAIQSKDDGGLRDLSMQMLDSAVAKKKGDAALLYKHGICCYLFGRPAESEASFDAYVKIETSPYAAWRGKLWLDKVRAERTAARAQDAAAASEDKARHAKEEASQAAAAARAAATAAAAPASAAPGDAPADPAAGGDRKTEIQAELAKLDQQIAVANGAAAAASSYGGKYGKVAEGFLQGPAAQAKLEEARARRTALQNELSGLK